MGRPLPRSRHGQGAHRQTGMEWSEGHVRSPEKDAQRAIDEAVSARMPERASTVEAYVEDRWLRMHPRSERTTKNYGGRVRNVWDLKLDGLELRNWDLRELKRHQMNDLVHLMLTEQGRAPGGARGVLRALSCMFEDAISDDLCETNPALRVKVREDDPRRRKDARTIRVWSWQEMHHVASSASYRPKRRTGRPKAEIRRAPEYEGMLRVIADCGPRIGEVFAIQRYGLDLNLEELESQPHLHGAIGTWAWHPATVGDGASVV